MMTLEEAIRHAEQVADSYKDTAPDCRCAVEHRQLAGWLKELQSIVHCGECKWGSDKQTGEAVYCEWHGFPWNVNGFCSYGERKNDERYNIDAE